MQKRLEALELLQSATLCLEAKMSTVSFDIELFLTQLELEGGLLLSDITEGEKEELAELFRLKCVQKALFRVVRQRQLDANKLLALEVTSDNFAVTAAKIQGQSMGMLMALELILETPNLE